ncbi:PH domain-containing protein [Microbacterium sp. A94]|uniref:PH domain-containing protein n=1 Tax=Microbacterium sp. A94 TaxID=3450717 RepID=UPI003F41F78E
MRTAIHRKRVFPATGAVILLAICAVITLVLLADAAIRSGLENAVLLAPWPLLVLWGVYVVGIASGISADSFGMRVQNFLRRTSAPWSMVKRIDMRWQLEVTFADESVLRCFGGPTRSRPRRLGPERTREDASPEDDGIAMLRRLRADAVAGGVPRSGISRSWDMPAFAALIVLVIWAVIAVAVTR